MEERESDPEGGFSRERHVALMEMMAEELPGEYATQEVNRLTLAYFALSSLSILRALHRVDKDQVVNWVLSFQSHPGKNSDWDNGPFYGFYGSRTSQFSADENEQIVYPIGGHLASTYCALAILKMVGYDLSIINSEALLISMRRLQQHDGSFMPIHFGAETDLRFVYCAAAISSMLKDWSGMDKEKAKEYILKCQSYDGGFGLVPGSESHAKIEHSTLIDVPLLVEWSLRRQAEDGGFQGRLNKPSDTCYAFWVGGVLKMLGAYYLLDHGALRQFLLSCQSPHGGFTKFPRERIPDLYHTYYGFAALSLSGEQGLDPLCVELGITM
ncbi:Geranylgeranyl transferase type-1 subunit beta [Ananas comosus]|uniref:Geranylgeranyl transferase type-1 subunit beta n=1 Tax=Ananas comosus TaxID=4615 RepID=A0A199VKL4_ANACO|nr:Geranylgeranyl transferase type-1 subunit beta [Ananas comosus]